MTTGRAEGTGTMRWPRGRFTIRSLMIAVAVVAALFVLPGGWVVFVIILSVPCLAVLGAQRLVILGERHLAALAFWSLAILANVLYVAACIVPGLTTQVLLFLGWLFVVLPTLVSLGSAWVNLSTRKGA